MSRIEAKNYESEIRKGKKTPSGCNQDVIRLESRFPGKKRVSSELHKKGRRHLADCSVYTFLHSHSGLLIVIL